ncbi:MAG: hypothetical protein M1839_005290 [Geoglossum umbratile]|nr:MAG: hypothetical protein M1839_005290 [Geoglossum umbratile]
MRTFLSFINGTCDEICTFCDKQSDFPHLRSFLKHLDNCKSKIELEQKGIRPTKKQRQTLENKDKLCKLAVKQFEEMEALQNVEYGQGSPTASKRQRASHQDTLIEEECEGRRDNKQSCNGSESGATSQSDLEGNWNLPGDSNHDMTGADHILPNHDQIINQTAYATAPAVSYNTFGAGSVPPSNSHITDQHEEAAYAIAPAASYDPFGMGCVPPSHMDATYAIAPAASYGTFNVEGIPPSHDHVTGQHAGILHAVAPAISYDTFGTRLFPSCHQVMSQHTEVPYEIAPVVSNAAIGWSYRFNA